MSLDPKTTAVICALSQTKEGRRAFAAMDDERQEACIHCQKVWYAIHHKDGVCHRCQKKGLPGRMLMMHRAQVRLAFTRLALWAVVFAAFWYLSGLIF